MSRRRRWNVAPPRNEAERKVLCGFDQSAMERYWDKNADQHQAFFLSNQTESPPDTANLWDMVLSVTGENPDTTPQPAGDCVSASAAEACEALQCSEIYDGDAEEFRDIYKPFTYGVGRVLIMKNSLRGRDGAYGGAVAEGMRKYGVLQVTDDLPDYNKQTVQAFGDDRKVNGKSFRDYLETAGKHVIGTTSRITSMGHLFESIGSKYPLTIASNCGYAMGADREGFHRPSGTWSHQMGIWGYSISGGWVAIKNQWGDVHGTVVDFQTKKKWPPGFMRVRIEDFEKRHFRGAEVIAYSQFSGFPQRKYDHRALS